MDEQLMQIKQKYQERKDKPEEPVEVDPEMQQLLEEMAHRIKNDRPEVWNRVASSPGPEQEADPQSASWRH